MAHMLLKRLALLACILLLAACSRPAPTPAPTRRAPVRPTLARAPLVQPTLTNQPVYNLKPVVESSGLMKGCATASVWIRFGPGKKFSQAGGLKKNECRLFDARDAEGTWIRLSENDTGKDGKRLWAAAEFIELEGEVEELRVAK